MWRIINWSWTLDPKRGLGILYDIKNNSDDCKAFYEDGTVQQAKKNQDYESRFNYLKRYSDTTWTRFTNKEKEEMEAFVEKGTCVFTLSGETGLEAILMLGKKSVRISVEKSGYSYDVTCSCKKKFCIHIHAAGKVLQNRMERLQHSYVITDAPVDKTQFLEPELVRRVYQLQQNQQLDETTIRSIQEVIRLLDAANSDDYYWKFHDQILNLGPEYDYDAHFLEEFYDYFLLALFEDEGYWKAVLDSGSYADSEEGEGRQHRSNRACFKRTLKEYGKVVREMDRQDDYEQDTYKELLLKYREDLRGLLRYYAEGKETLDLFDLPYLDRIAELPETDSALLCMAAAKLDPLYETADAVRTFLKLTANLPSGQKIELYTGLRNLTMPMEEIWQLDPSDQRRMINNTPLTLQSFRFILDNLLNESSPAEKGRYILRTVQRIPYPGDARLKQAVAEAAALLPDNKLFLAYVVSQLRVKGEYEFNDGIPEKELTAYFSCTYKIVNENSSFYAEFSIKDPESDFRLLSAREENGKLSGGYRSGFMELSYDPKLIRKVCLAGKEDEYEKACARNRDEVEVYLFEKKNQRFAKGYRALCDSLMDEKYLFTETNRAGIDWMIYREEDTNALAFKIGHTKKYVVKDATEFLNAFKNGSTEKYGKDLVLTHDPDNLSGGDADAIRILMAAKYKKGRYSDKNNKRYITVSDSVLESLLEILSGRQVLYNDMDCLLRMESRKIRLKISGKYVLSSDIKVKTQSFLNLVGKGYLVTTTEKSPEAFIDRVEGTAEEINLIDFVLENPGVGIKPILADFKKNIYARFFEMFDVDKEVQQDFVLSRIRFNTYFDFEKSMVTARITALKENTEIPCDNLTERIDQVKYELLNNYLSTLGFTDGVMDDESRILSFFKMDFTRLKSLTNVYLSEKLQNKEIKTISKPVIRVACKNDLMSVFLEKSEYSEEELEQIVNGIRRKKKFILMSGDRIIDLDSENARDFGEAVTDFGMDPKNLYKKKNISMITAIKAFSHERCCRVDKYLRDMIEEIRAFKEADIALPKLSGELREYQAEGYKWMSILASYGMGGILADDMGLGKTIQVIALIKADRTRKPSIVVCPKSLIFNWISEFTRFDGTTPVKAIYGPDSIRTELIGSINYKEKAVYVTSYETLRNDIEKYAGQFNYGILDETQYIKNVNALKTKSVKELKADHRFALTGTPIENSVVDLWSIFDYIMPGYFEELSRFKTSDNTSIARKAGPFILRRVKEDVLEELPAKYERIVSADMSAGQRKLYEAMRMDARKRLEEGGKAFDMLPYLTRLRQICVDPSMFVEGYASGSGKMELLSTMIPEYLQEGHRILVFSQFVKALEEVDRMLHSKGIDTFFLSGATAAKDRIRMMDDFNNGSGTDVFLISLKAGGTGLNLTGADTVIHLDPWWNVAAENQASDRAHRIGQTRNVEVIKLIADDSIEQKVVELQDIKKEIIRQVISDDDGSVTSASLEDIAFVLG